MGRWDNPKQKWFTQDYWIYFLFGTMAFFGAYLTINEVLKGVIIIFGISFYILAILSKRKNELSSRDKM